MQWNPAYPGAYYGYFTEVSKHRAEDSMHPLTVLDLIAKYGTVGDLAAFNRRVQC